MKDEPTQARPGDRAATGDRPRLSVVIPVYNETRRMGRTLPQLLAYLHSRDYTYEIVIVDDGSSDGTPALARELLQEEPDYSILPQAQNMGKGHSVKVGMLAAKGQYVLFTDADLSTPPTELDKFWQWLDAGYDVVIGSRKMAGADVQKHQPLWRESLGKVFTLLTNRIATRNISDVTCGFKCFSYDAAHTLFGLSLLSDWSFDAEIMFLAQRHGYRIKQVPVSWHDEPGTKVRLWKDAATSLLGLLRIRLNAMQGKYKTKGPTKRSVQVHGNKKKG